MTNNLPLFLRKTLAWGVHLFTASGAAWGFLAILAIQAGDYRAAIAWMVLAMFVDGFDGMLARWLDVKTYASGINGALLDNILDYFNYVVVPAYFLYASELLPPGWQLAGAISILLTSAYQFTQVDAKTDDHYFKGFPSYWNVLVLYLLILPTGQWFNLAALVFFNILVFVPVKYVYPSRNKVARRLTLTLSYLYAIIGVYGLLHYPDVPAWIPWASFVYVAYYVGLSLWPKKIVQPEAMAS
jgi:phosphatidylcholine synthase